MTERIMCVGDVHGDGDFLLNAVEWARRNRCTRVVQFGDLGFGWPGMEGDDFMSRVKACAEMLPMNWVPGNHENYDLLESMAPIRGTEPAELLPGFRHLPRGCVVRYGERTKVLVCGGAISIDRKWRKRSISVWDQESIDGGDVAACVGAGLANRIDVMFTHDCPSSVPIPGFHSGNKILDKPSEWNRAALQTVLEAAEPNLVVHGHHHVRYTFEGGIARVEGLASNLAMDLGASTMVWEAE